MDIVYFPIKSYDIDIDRLKNGVIDYRYRAQRP